MRNLVGAAAVILAVTALALGLVGGTGGVAGLVPDPAAPATPAEAAADGDARSAGVTFATVATTNRAAPLGARRVGVWYSPAPDRYTPAMLWKFDPVSHSVPSGFRTDYVKVGTLAPFPKSFPFTYRTSGSSVYLTYPTGTRSRISLVSYSSSRNTLQVRWDGYPRVLVGCGSSAFPALYRVYC